MSQGESGEDVRTRTCVNQESMLPTRREFLVSVSGLALAGLPRSATAQAPAPLPSANSGPDLREICEIRSESGKLRGVVTVHSGSRIMPADPNLGLLDRPAMLRYFEGKDSTGKVVWPPSVPSGSPQWALPGPTLRARVGDQVEITFLNQIHTDEFGATMDRAEQGLGCDTLTPAAGGQSLYPGVAGDNAPDCFHGSTTVNMHFHGTHVTPDGLGDNVLLQLRANPNITEDVVRADFETIFAAGPPAHWGELPKTWRDMQLKLLKDYDDTAVWQGQRGTPGNPALPHENQLLPQAMASIDRGDWPQYQIGAHPFCFKLTEYFDKDKKRTQFQMGQCPGTHWYHAHKHGSTAINVYNGMAGVFVIEGDYDDWLKKTYPTLREKVLIVQNLSETPNLMDQAKRGMGTPPSLWVNGSLLPAISMRPGEIQLWRLVNASVRAVTTLLGFGSDSGLQIRQIAQDGVQFKFENYQSQPLLGAPGNDKRPINTFAPGNRVDLLVKAPDKATTSQFFVNDTTLSSFQVPILTVKVGGDNSPMEFPTIEDQYPDFPDFLGDISKDQPHILRTLDFSWEKGRSGPAANAKGAAPQFMINGQQFHEGVYNQTMVLGDVEEWTLTNSTATIAHPFHIHINPFQVVELFDPVAKIHYKPEKDFIWQDVIAIPPSDLDGEGNVKPGGLGYVKIRHRFVDFTGSYVLHCHMLAHEDRGMMQLVRVISPTAVVQHH